MKRAGLSVPSSGTSKARSTTGSARDSQPPPGATPAVQFMKQKKSLKEMIDEYIRESVGKQSCVAKVESMEVKKDMELPHDPSELAKTLGLKTKALNGYKTRLDTMQKSSSLDPITKEIDATYAEYSQVIGQYGEQLDAMQYLTSETKKDAHREKMRHHYHANKVVAKLRAGAAGWGGIHAKRMPSHLSPTVPAANAMFRLGGDDVEFGKVCLWSKPPDDKEPPKISKSFDGLFDHDTLTKKMGSLVEVLLATPKWAGAMKGRECEIAKFAEWGLAERPALLEEPGSLPWLNCFLPWAWRTGPGAWPMPGIGSFVKSLDNLVYLQIISIEAFNSQGVGPTDIPACLETETGGRLWDTSSMILPLAPGSVAWVPYGYVTYPLIVGDVDSKKKGPAAGDCGKVVVLPLFSQSEATKLDEAVWKALVIHNRQHFKKMLSKDLWSNRHTTFEKCVSMVREVK